MNNDFRHTSNFNKYTKIPDIIIKEPFSINVGDKTILKDIEFKFIGSKNLKYAIIGENGSGKSSFLKYIIDRNVKEINNLLDSNEILLVEQQTNDSMFDDEMSAINYLISSNFELLRIEIEIKILENEIEENEFEENEFLEINNKLNDLFEQFEFNDGDISRTNASSILSGLQFSETQKELPIKYFSGGWRVRLSLARALFLNPKLLILDEPTNHLDLHATIWLEDYLKEYKGILLFVSHDESFIEEISNGILHIWQRRLFQYPSYEIFKKNFNEMFNICNNYLIKKNTKFKKNQIEILNNFLENGDIILEKFFMKQKIFSIQCEKENNILVQIKDVSFKYNDDQIILNYFDYGIKQNEKIALVGKNGSGKSTLLNLLIGNLIPNNGEIIHHRNCKIGYYNQYSCENLGKDNNYSSIEYLQNKCDFKKSNSSWTINIIRGTLVKFGLENIHHEKKLKNLSSGEKARVILTEFSLLNCNILLLDEPTNHLDLEAVKCLKECLKLFNGALIISTHDISFIKEICYKLWEIENGYMEEYDDIDQYIKDIKKSINFQILNKAND